MLPFCNRWLKWAFIKATWVAIGCSDYFGTFYKRHRGRGKGSNEAITTTARRMAKIAWKMLTEQRDYSKVPSLPATFPDRSRFGLTTSLASVFWVRIESRGSDFTMPRGPHAPCPPLREV